MESLDTGFDGSLYDWNDIKDISQYNWKGILLGNGASIAVWDGFKYASIFSKAASCEIENPLTMEDLELFTAFGNTTNFEQILSSLAIAKTVNVALSLDTKLIETRYESIKHSLIETISKIHIPWMRLPEIVEETIRNELHRYEYVYSTNYDLIIYWSIMHNRGLGFVDYFFSPYFDIGNTEVWDGDSTKVLYLHGALHLYSLPTGQTLKRKARAFNNLLDLFGQPMENHPDAAPLFITEGDSNGKLISINRSDYLSFAHNKFSQHEGNLVIFGHSLSENDQHLLDSISKLGRRTLAISIVPDTERNIKRIKSRLLEKLPDAQVYFFNAFTHTLGLPALKQSS